MGIIKNIKNVLNSQYVNENYIVRQKVHFMFIFLLASVIASTLGTASNIYSVFHGRPTAISAVYISIALISIELFSIRRLLKGDYHFARILFCFSGVAMVIAYNLMWKDSFFITGININKELIYMGVGTLIFFDFRKIAILVAIYFIISQIVLFKMGTAGFDSFVNSRVFLSTLYGSISLTIMTILIVFMSKTSKTAIEVAEQSEKALVEKTKDLKHLNEYIIHAEENDRKVFAEDLHDTVAQTLAISISKIKNIQEAGVPINWKIIAEVQEHLDDAVVEVRSLICQLSPSILNDFDIDVALGFLIEESNEKYDINIKYINKMDDSVYLSEANKIILYRAVNELIINIIKHSNSKDAEIEISIKENFILLRVEDSGIGFELNKSTGKNGYGFGIYSVSERITNLGGSFELFSKLGKGTKILFSIPLSSENDIENQKAKSTFGG
ncbi:MAG: hypothetical protein KAR45_12965 [Desulfobacteraceae bacterium]|nr:hypothetical protein [Desulfobacteraceae bacterium]